MKVDLRTRRALISESSLESLRGPFCCCQRCREHGRSALDVMRGAYTCTNRRYTEQLSVC
eukprot:5104992-Pleurochrysis_carterae.AAC.1